MNLKHLKARVSQCDLIATLSPCPRRKVGALIIDPQSNSIVSEGYNGTPRDSSRELCGGVHCVRQSRYIESGTRNDVGCHHAEMNAILNATRTGHSTLGAWLVSSCDPCLMCAKAIHHAGIVTVYSPHSIDSDHRDGLDYLAENQINLESTDTLTKELT